MSDSSVQRASMDIVNSSHYFAIPVANTSFAFQSRHAMRTLSSIICNGYSDSSPAEVSSHAFSAVTTTRPSAPPRQISFMRTTSAVTRAQRLTSNGNAVERDIQTILSNLRNYTWPRFFARRHLGTCPHSLDNRSQCGHGPTLQQGNPGRPKRHSAASDHTRTAPSRPHRPQPSYSTPYQYQQHLTHPSSPLARSPLQSQSHPRPASAEMAEKEQGPRSTSLTISAPSRKPYGPSWTETTHRRQSSKQIMTPCRQTQKTS